MSPTSSWLISPSTISTTFNVASSVTPHALMPANADAHRLQQIVDPPSAAVHDDRIHADEPQQRDVAREALLQHGIRHRAAAEADDERRRVERPDERQRLGEDPGLLQR